MTYYVDLVWPFGKVEIRGNHTPREKNPGCGDTPGPAGIPARKAGGCPWMGATVIIHMIYIFVTY